MNVLPHPDFDGAVLVSDTGRIFRAARMTRKGPLPQREFAQRRHHQNGYWLVQFEIDGQNYTRLAHRLVLETFVGPRPRPGMEACHGPAGNGDNSLGNLRWDTRAANLADAARVRAAMLDPLAQ